MKLHHFFIVFLSLLGAYITFTLYNSFTEWGFSIAFLGGAITLAITEVIRYKCSKQETKENVLS